jgi:hypothetical protein
MLQDKSTDVKYFNKRYFQRIIFDSHAFQVFMMGGKYDGCPLCLRMLEHQL